MILNSSVHGGRHDALRAGKECEEGEEKRGDLNARAKRDSRNQSSSINISINNWTSMTIKFNIIVRPT